ncbi:TetR/AcrR family transcriptional regulator [Paenibacillus methanolicus]|uniref:AcrR family transcriptional regulator n=1 Tax=Paenibacillus methanolicus TaxID=582686 RepID=A0A5S5CHS6_9BACL|nr:TetR/AcrR family transcriptional regulator [Paenibacillus methanolicus]TYP79349.1 AcrR family transcriptional regulator [Paenibacillus methanolicus]
MLRSARKQQLKETIYAKAMQLFVEKGFDRVTVDEITSACGVAKGTFYNYFPKKEMVLLYMGESQMERVAGHLEALSRLPVIRQRIETLFAELAKQAAAQPELLRVSMSEMVRSSALLGEEMETIKRFEKAIIPLLNEAKASGQMQRGHSSELAAVMLVGLYFQTLMRFASGYYADEEQMQTSLLAQLQLAWQGIGGEE